MSNYAIRKAMHSGVVQEWAELHILMQKAEERRLEAIEDIENYRCLQSKVEKEIIDIHNLRGRHATFLVKQGAITVSPSPVKITTGGDPDPIAVFSFQEVIDART